MCICANNVQILGFGGVGGLGVGGDTIGGGCGGPGTGLIYIYIHILTRTLSSELHCGLGEQGAVLLVARRSS